MSQSIDIDSDPRNGNRRPRSRVFDVLTILFLLTIITLIALTILPKRNESNGIPIDYEVTPPPAVTPEGDLYPPVPPIGGEHVIYNFDSNEEKKEETPLKVGDIKLPKPRQAHPEDFDVDDLPFSRGMNPNREKRHTVFYRIAPFIDPREYDVNITVTVRGRNGAQQSTIVGVANIYFRANGDASNLLEIHAEKLNLNLMYLISMSSKATFEPIHAYYNEDKRTAVFLLDKPMRDGEEYALGLNWTAAVSTKGFLGVYETWSTLPDGKRSYQLATQGEVAGTRQWMPAFDEPALKATLSLRITHPVDLNARSNSPVESTSEVESTRTTAFSKTARISPYLYAWSLTDYPEKSTVVNGVKVSVISDIPEENLSKCFAQATSAVQSYYDALNITQRHVFEKMDFVFVPDHMSGMENVGHITVGSLFIDILKNVYEHEMMHQYFGNLITLSWWDEVWINEGLTTMYEIDAAFGIGTQEAIDVLREKRDLHMRFDSLRKTIPLKNEATTGIEAMGNFDKSYTKGSVVLFMLRHLVGQKEWKEGVETFLNKFAYQAVTGDDFLRAIKEVCEKYHPKEKIEFAVGMAKDFFELRGFPLLKIMRNGKKIELRQVRFVRGFYDDPTKEKIPFATHHWRLPVYLVKLDGTPYKTIFMTSKEMIIDVDTDDELIIDPKKIVYFRVIYGTNTYKKLAESSLREQDIKYILYDLLHSSLSGYADPSFAFDVIFDDFHLKGDSQVIEMMYKLLDTMFHFDKERLSRVNKLFNPEGKQLDDILENQCPNISSLEDARKEYSRNRQSIILFFCNEVKKAKGVRLYEELLESFLFGDEQIFNPQDISSFIHYLNKYYPNLFVDWAVGQSNNKTLTEHEFASILFQIKSGFNFGHTEQLRQIFENSPRATRENREFITRIFNQRHAAITEAQQLGDKIESALRKHLTKSNYPSSRVITPAAEHIFNLKPEADPSLGLHFY